MAVLLSHQIGLG